MHPLLMVIAALLAAIGMAQVLSIRKLYVLRRSLDKTVDLSTHPEVRKWMRRCRYAWLAATLASCIALVVERQDGIYVLMAGLGGSTLLTILAASIADNSTSHGDGDSGG